MTLEELFEIELVRMIEHSFRSCPIYLRIVYVLVFYVNFKFDKLLKKNPCPDIGHWTIVLSLFNKISKL